MEGHIRKKRWFVWNLPSSYVLDLTGDSCCLLQPAFDVRILEIPQGLKPEEFRVDAEPQKCRGWAIEEHDSEVGLTLGTLASFEVLLLVVSFGSGVVDVVKLYLWLLLLDYVHSVFNTPPEGCESCL